MHAGTRKTDRRERRGFTLVEVIFVILLIAILLSISLVGIQAASRGAQSAADRQAVLALKVGVDSFKMEFGFVPPLVKGARPPFIDDPYDPTTKRVNSFNPSVAADLTFLRGRSAVADGSTVDPDGVYRYSLQSLPYFLAGSLDAEADGLDGPGYRAPRRDGSFATSGPTYPSFVDVSKKSMQLWQNAETDRQFVVEFRDRNGLPIRYYRWMPESDTELRNSGLSALNIPKILGEASGDGNAAASAADANPALRDADYAIVAAGPNRAFGDLPTGAGDSAGTESLEEVRRAIGASSAKGAAAIEQEARKDNLVETGK